MRSTLFLFVVVSVLCSSLVSGQRGQLLVQKQIESDIAGLFSVGQILNVTLNLYNVGQGSAHEVTVTDRWPNTFQLSWGSFEAKFDEIPAGEHRSVNYSVEATAEGVFPGTAADVEYNPTPDETNQIGYSTALPALQVISADQYDKYTNKHYVEWGLFSLGLSASFLIPFGIWFNIQHSNEQNGAAGAGKKKQ